MTIPTCPHARRDKTRLTAQLQTLPHFTANASNPMLGKFIRALLRPIAAQYGLFVALLLRNTGSLSPYCYAIRALCRPIATQYGLRLRLCAHCVARIRLRYRPISRVALNTGSLSSRGCAPLTPGCILAPLQGARGSRIWQIAAISRSRTVGCAIKCFVIMDALFRKFAIFFSYHALLQHLVHQLLITVHMVVCHKTIRQFCEELLGTVNLGLLDWA